MATVASASAATAAADMASNQVSLAELALAFEVIQEFANQPIDGITAAKVVRLSRWARQHYLRFSEIRSKSAEEFGEKISDGKYRVNPERFAEFNQAMAHTRTEYVTIDPSLKIDVRALGSIKISPSSIEMLEPFLSGI